MIGMHLVTVSPWLELNVFLLETVHLEAYSRVMFDDGSYLTFVLMGDLTHRDSEFVDMTSFFVYPFYL